MVSGQFDHMTVRPLKGFVAIEQRLHRVLAGLQVSTIANGISKHARVRRIHSAWFPRFPIVHVQAEDNLRFRAVIDLETRLIGRVGGEQQQQAPVKWCSTFGRIETDGKGNCSPARGGRQTDLCHCVNTGNYCEHSFSHQRPRETLGGQTNVIVGVNVGRNLAKALPRQPRIFANPLTDLKLS